MRRSSPAWRPGLASGRAPALESPLSMTLHLLKLCVGVDAVGELEAWQRRRLAEARRRGRAPVLVHRTRAMPRRRPDVLAGGSIYWVIRGLVQVRQRILDLAAGADRDGRTFCEIRMDAKLVRTVLQPHRPFQGWRYLEPERAPPDLPAGAVEGELPPALVAKLRALGLI